MYPRSTMLVPLFKSYSRLPVKNCRNFSGRMFPLDVRGIIREMERQMYQEERNFFRNFPLRIITPRLMPIEGQDPDTEKYRLNIDVQGFKPEDIKISLKDRIMKIEAHMDTISEDGSKFQQSIVREFTLPTNVEQSTVKSLLHESGILSIEASLNKENEPKGIPIQIDTEKPK